MQAMGAAGGGGSSVFGVGAGFRLGRPTQDKHIHLRVQGHLTDSAKNSGAHFKIKETTRLDKLLEAYCVRQNLGMQEVNFYYNGGRGMQDDTAQKLKMEEDEVIQAMPAAGGGISFGGNPAFGVGALALKEVDGMSKDREVH